MDYLARAKAVIDCERDGLARVRDGLDNSFTAAVDLILACLAQRGKIVVTGVGKNLHIAEKVSATLASTGSTSVALNPTQAMHGDLGMLSKGDILLALSYSGESEELVALLPVARRMGALVIALSGVPDSTLALNSDVTVSVAVDREACPFNMAPTTSTTATLAVGDALAMVLLEARGFQKTDYAKLHPGGAIGRALLLRVADIMRGRERLPVTQASAPVRDALLAMTALRSGSCAVIDANNILTGIFTDGDLRRHLPRHADLLQLAVGDVMTGNPVTVGPDELAVDVLNIFETRNIDDLLVVDGDGHPLGAIDIQDLPKLKIM
jgi:arabinose-5-phosphate isomerase